MCERPWRCFRVAGSMPFSMVGGLAALVQPLAGFSDADRTIVEMGHRLERRPRSVILTRAVFHARSAVCG
jgi:hypothetical protein